MTLPLLPIAQIQALLLIFSRVAGIFTAAPVLGSERVPIPIRAGLAFLIAGVLVPVTPLAAGIADGLLPFAGLAVKEMAVGMVIGFVSNLVFLVIQMAGEFADLQAGFGFAGMLDPVYGGKTSIIGQFQNLLALLIFVGLNGHHLLIAGVVDSFNALPLGAVTIAPTIASGFVEVASRLLLMVIKIGAPVIFAVLLADIAMGMVARTVPQMNLLVLGFPVKMSLALVTVFLALPLFYAATATLCTTTMHHAVAGVLASAH
jgi:flagellar biosynthetic protein FliR